LKRINSLLGTALTAENVLSILPLLEIDCKLEDKETFILQIPTFRPDLTRPVDVIEEIAIMYGYNKIPFSSQAMLDQSQGVNERVVFQDYLRTILAGLGLRETLSLSLVPSSSAELFLPEGGKLVELLNPLSTEWAVFRSSLLISLLQNTAHNRNRQSVTQRFFELGNAASLVNGKYIERKQIVGIVAGEIQEPSWYDKGRQFDFYDIKGIVLQLIKACGISSYQLRTAKESYWAQESVSLVIEDDVCLGTFGRIDEQILASYKIKTKAVFAFQFDFDLLFEKRLQHRVFEPIPRFPSVPFDIALLIDANIPVGEVEAAIRQEGGPNLVSLQLFDFYKGEQVPEGKKSVAFSLTFCSKERTLGDEDVAPNVANVLAHLKDKFGIELRPR
jgi:phenylalanyl-tRNA synthetase beta chain